MRTLGNIIWFLFGGVFVFMEYLLASVILCCTIIGIPFGIQTMKMAMLALWPFGKEVRPKENGNGLLSLIMNIIWFFIGGIWICLSHVLLGVIFFVTIIGIPFGKQHFKLAGLALRPFGKEIIDK